MKDVNCILSWQQNIEASITCTADEQHAKAVVLILGHGRV
jgi:hypothetical protein